MDHIISVHTFTKDWIENLCDKADMLRTTPSQSCTNKILATLFYEPSTRTRFSFESAMLRLGGTCITTENAAQFSSVTKGETLEDSIRIIGGYVDAIVLRHPEEHAAERAAAVSNVPIINAGDGAHEHPTQALLDLYTIRNTFGKITNQHIVFVGDLKYGRTVHSLSKLLCHYPSVHISFVAPPSLSVPEEITQYLAHKGVTWDTHDQLTPVLGTADIIYQTRVQQERLSEIDRAVATEGFILTLKEVSHLKRRR